MANFAWKQLLILFAPSFFKGYDCLECTTKVGSLIYYRVVTFYMGSHGTLCNDYKGLTKTIETKKTSLVRGFRNPRLSGIIA